MKLYDNIISRLRSFFGMPDATESELDQKLADAGTFEAIQKASLDAAKAEIGAQIQQLSQKVTDAEASISGLSTKVEEMQAALDSAKETIAQKDAEIKAKDDEIKNLSAEIGTLKLEKSTIKQTVADGGIEPPSTARKSNAVVVTNEQLMEMFK